MRQDIVRGVNEQERAGEGWSPLWSGAGDVALGWLGVCVIDGSISALPGQRRHEALEEEVVRALRHVPVLLQR